MSNQWPTKEKDLELAQLIMEAYAQHEQMDTLGLFELMVDQKTKTMDFQLATWVVTLLEQYNALYGVDQGDWITRKVISRCIVRDEVLH